MSDDMVEAAIVAAAVQAGATEATAADIALLADRSGITIKDGKVIGADDAVALFRGDGRDAWFGQSLAPTTPRHARDMGDAEYKLNLYNLTHGQGHSFERDRLERAAQVERAAKAPSNSSSTANPPKPAPTTPRHARDMGDAEYKAGLAHLKRTGYLPA